MFNRSKNDKIYRHGDLLIRKVSVIPNSARIISTNILAYGEKTGHHHKISGSHQMYQIDEPNVNPKQPTKYFDAKEKVKLTHQEHNTITIPKGLYVVVNERQFNPFENVSIQVLD